MGAQRRGGERKGETIFPNLVLYIVSVCLHSAPPREHVRELLLDLLCGRLRRRLRRGVGDGRLRLLRHAAERLLHPGGRLVHPGAGAAAAAVVVVVVDATSEAVGRGGEGVGKYGRGG